MYRVVIFFGLACLLLGACVPNKKILYLQSENELKRDFPTDTILRTYTLSNFEYRIQPEDILSIRIESLTPQEYDFFTKTQPEMGNSNLTTMIVNGYLVHDNGTIEFPVEGQVKVAGLTLKEVNNLIQNIANKYLSNTTVYVRLLNYRVTILGEVNSPGTITIVNNRSTIMEVIGSAGGLTELADRSKIKLIRQNGNDVDVSHMDLLNEQFISSSHYYAHQNDIIIVPPLKQRPFRKYFGQNVSLILSSASTLLLIINLLNN